MRPGAPPILFGHRQTGDERDLLRRVVERLLGAVELAVQLLRLRGLDDRVGVAEERRSAVR